ncbi:MAG: molybdopterin-synthase adenylyltransferase MoeB [Chloroflexi bacterium]|nr:molybdopterin-synthase adenylyltransferase MoeB [Chloroflexota bacterium]
MTPTPDRHGPGPVAEVGPAEAASLRDEGAILLDVREPSEWQEGHLEGAIHLPQGRLHAGVAAAVPDRDASIVVYCRSGNRSHYATAALGQLGYRHVVNLAGGIIAWQRAGLPVVVPPAEPLGPGGLTTSQRERYSRQLLMPEVGPEGQARLLASKVLIVGAGGLGSPAALYLAAAGVGTLGLVDDDVVDASNLQRQVLHATDAVGAPKVASARRTLAGLNPDVRVVAQRARLDDSNVAQLIAGYDVILDGTDSFETRYLLNDAAVEARIPVVHASVFRFEGQVTTFVPFEGPCYRCLYPTPPPPELAPSCSVVGVLGVVPGIMGMLQANEVLKLLLGIGETLAGRLLVFDALDSTFSEIRLERDPACPACSEPRSAPIAAS